MEAGPLVRAEGAGGRGQGPPDDRHAARPEPRGRAGSGWATRSRAAAGSPTPSSPRRRPRPRPRRRPTAHGSPAWRSGGTMLAGKDEAKRAEAEAGPAGGDRPARRAGGLGRLRQRLGGPPGRRGPAAGPDRRPGGVAGPGGAGRLQPGGRGPPGRHRRRSRGATRATSCGCWSTGSATRSSTRSGRSAGRARRGSLFVEGKQFNVRRIYGTPAVASRWRMRRRSSRSDVPFDPFSLQNILMANGSVGMPSGRALRAGRCSASPPDPQNAPAILAQQRRPAGNPGTRSRIPRPGSVPDCPAGEAIRPGTSCPRTSIVAVTMVAAAGGIIELGLDRDRASSGRPSTRSRRLSNDVRRSSRPTRRSTR